MKRRFTPTALALLLLAACGPKHFITDEAVRRTTEQDLAAKREALPEGDLFRVFDLPLSDAEREAMTFLYAYMPLGDITDYPAEYHLENYRLAERARSEMPWGAAVPEKLFRHFVVPVRVNNENLDDARRVFYDELAPRVAGLSMYDAVLEVNHWCHEKAVYTPSDARTSSPLATVRTGSGRCGEESTLLVAALRSVAIPARQVYTPRWAHTDDNHAWVEAWADGRWHFLGACEPEPVLDLGWFNAPASRGMLMHTKVFGRYEGPEEIVGTTTCHTEINVTANYADTARVEVTVVDEGGRPVPEAMVEFKIYNYAEFYTVATRRSDAEGHASLTAGRGDVLVWASRDGRFGFKKVSVGKERTAIVALDRRVGEPFRIRMDITPPAGRTTLPAVTPEQRAENDRRMALEDSLRNAYTSTFPDKAAARGFVAANGLDQRAVELLIASKGNHATIESFLADAARNGRAARAVELLASLSEKDLRDVTRTVLDDAMDHTAPEADVRRVLCPRVANEMLTPYRELFREAIPASEAAAFRDDPARLAAWCDAHIVLRDDLNAPRIPVSPEGVWRSRRADAASRDLFFVAVARSLGIPAWKDEVTGAVRYRTADGRTVDVQFGRPAAAPAPSGTLRASFRPIPMLDNPKYYNHFTLSKFDDEGSFRLLNYDEAATWRSLLRDGAELESGCYLMVSGTRLAGGGVLAEMVSLPVESGRRTQTELVMREDAAQIRVIGSFDSEARFLPADAKTACSILQAVGRGYFAVGILGAGQEPTNHALRDLAAMKEELEGWGRGIVLLFGSEEELHRFDPAEFPPLPSNVIFGTDPDGTIRRMIARNMELHGDGQRPLFVVADTFNRVVFFSEGYTIGLGEQMTKVIRGI